jgi:4'-phosphopantetheinyl transferase
VKVYWLEQSASEVPCGDEWLNGSERARLSLLHVPKRRADWRLGRWTAKCAVAAYLNLPHDPEGLAAIEVRPAPTGAPEVVLDGQFWPLAISISHSHGTGLCAIAPAAAGSTFGIGCDLEAVQPRSLAFLADYFTEEERNMVARTPAARQNQIVTLLWSAKESALKALGCGLRLDTRSVIAAPADCLPPDGDGWAPLSVAHAGGRALSGWWHASRGLVRTVVADPPLGQLVAL